MTTILIFYRKAMLRFRLRTLFIGITVVGITLALTPTINCLLTWRRGQIQLEEFAQTNYLKYGWEDVNAKARPIFEDTIKKIRLLGPFAKEGEKLKILENCVLDLNEIQNDESIENYIGDVERGSYCDVVFTIGRCAGIDFWDRINELREF